MRRGISVSGSHLRKSVAASQADGVHIGAALTRDAHCHAGRVSLASLSRICSGTSSPCGSKYGPNQGYRKVKSRFALGKSHVLTGTSLFSSKAGSNGRMDAWHHG